MNVDNPKPWTHASASQVERFEGFTVSGEPLILDQHGRCLVSAVLTVAACARNVDDGTMTTKAG